MSRRTGWLLLGCCVLLAGASPAWAGMAAPLPEDRELAQVLRLNGSALERLQAASFFLLALLLCAAALRFLWNFLQRDFPSLPRLSLGKAVVGVVLWGLLFVLVLAMIGGARELMTPGAWRKQGFTYQLDREPAPSAEPNPEQLRRRHLEQLRTALWHFAATHKGRFPSSEEMTALPSELWQVPESGGLRYQYVPGLSAGHAPLLLVSEPELDPEQRFVLRANGDILSVRSQDLRARAPQGGQ